MYFATFPNHPAEDLWDVDMPGDPASQLIGNLVESGWTLGTGSIVNQVHRGVGGVWTKGNETQQPGLGEHVKPSLDLGEVLLVSEHRRLRKRLCHIGSFQRPRHTRHLRITTFRETADSIQGNASTGLRVTPHINPLAECVAQECVVVLLVVENR